MSKFNFFYFEVVRDCSFVCCNGVCDSGISFTKINSNGTLQRDTREFNAAFTQNIPSISVVQFTVQMSKLNGIGKTHRERIFVVELKLKPRSLALSL